MKFNEDHVIIALVILIILTIWSKFMVSSGYAPGQAGSADTLPQYLPIGKDINITTWTAIGATCTNGESDGVAVLGSLTDKKLGPGDLNRQGWTFSTLGGAGTVYATTNFSSSTPVNGSNNLIFGGFRKTLQAGGGGDVYYLFVWKTLRPKGLSALAVGGTDYTASSDAPTLLTIGNFNIPKFVTYSASIVSPFADLGCTYRISAVGTCQATTSSSCGTIGSQLKTLTLVRATTGLQPCVGPDGKDIATATPSAYTTSVSTAISATNSTLTTSIQPNASLANFGLNASTAGSLFSNTAASNNVLYYAASCVPPGCGSIQGGFLQNNGTVMTIAGTVGSTTAEQDGIGQNGSVVYPGGALGAIFAAPTFIATGGSDKSVSNVFVSNVTAGSTTAFVIRQLYKETFDSPPLWKSDKITVTVSNQNAVKCSGLVADRVAPATGKIYFADKANGKIYKFGYDGTSPVVWTGLFPSSSPSDTSNVNGIYIDSTSDVTAGSYIYAVAASNIYQIPVGTQAGGIDATNSMIQPFTGLNTPTQIVVSGKLAYISNINQVSYLTLPTYALGLKTSVAASLFAGVPGGTAGTIGARGTGVITSGGEMVIDIANNIYIASGTNGNSILKIDGQGTISAFAGGGAVQSSTVSGVTSGSQDDGGSSAAAQPGGGALFNAPQGIAVAADGITMFVADTGNNTIRMIV